MGRSFAATAALVLLATGCAADRADETGVPADPSPESSGWQRLPDAPLSGRVGAVTAAVGDELVVVGGWEWLCPPAADCAFPELPLLADGAALDLGSGEWRDIADAPYGLRHSPSAVLGTDVYVLTGCHGARACDGRRELLRYDSRADRWRELGPAPAEVGYGQLVPVGGDLLALSDSDEYGERADHLYDVATGTWRALPDDPLPAVYDRFTVVDDDRLLVFGSPRKSTDEGPAPKVAAAYDLTNGGWTRLPDAPAGGWQAWRIGDEVWLNPHFGVDGGGVLELDSDTWRNFPASPTGPGWDGDMAGIVGEGEATYEYSSGWVRDTRSDRWLRVPSHPGAAEGEESVTAVGEALVVFGGQRWEESDGELLAETWVWRPPA